MSNPSAERKEVDSLGEWKAEKREEEENENEKEEEVRHRRGYLYECDTARSC